MGQSLASNLIHLVFSTKHRKPLLHPEKIKLELYNYIAGTAKSFNCLVYEIGGVEDHTYSIVFTSNSSTE